MQRQSPLLPLLSLLLLACTLCTSCRITSSSVSERSRSGIVLVEQRDANGRELRWRLYPGQGTAPRIERTESYTETTPRLGLTVGPVSRERASSVGVAPFEGVWVTSVEASSPASSMGVAVGDIILAVNGVAMSSREQYEDYVDQHAVVGEPLTHRLRVYRRQGEPLHSEGTADIDVVPVGQDVRQSSTDSIALEHSPGIQNYTGLQVAVLPAELCKEMYGEERNQLLVAGVVRGAPAYHAGLRMGDRVLTCDGQAAASLDQLRGAVLDRVKRERLKGPLLDFSRVEAAGRERAQSSQVVLEVDGPLGRHSARLGVDDDLEDETHVYVPILLDYDSDIRSADVSFLDFIFQFGFNYRSRVEHSTTRESIKTWKLSLLPLGMFEVERGATRNRYTLFWLIRFETRK